MNQPLRRWVWLLLALTPGWAGAMDFDFQAPSRADDPAMPAVLRDLAERILPVYQDDDRERYLSNLSALQLADSNYAAADDARQSLRERRKTPPPDEPPGRSVAMDLYTHAKTVAAAGTAPLPQAFAQSYRDTVSKLGDQDAQAVAAWLGAPPLRAREALQVALDRSRGSGRLSLDQAVDLIWNYLSLDAQRSLGPLVAPLAAEEQKRRYLGGDELVLNSPSGATVHVQVVRPKGNPARRPALLEFALAPSLDDAVACAAHGYVGVIAYSEAKGRHADGLVLFKHEGEDARTVIRWIARQDWSDGRVGMYGGGYGAFVAWSAARHLPAPLKAIATADAMAPGIDFPAPGRIFRNAAYPWALAADAPDRSSGRDEAQWRELDRKWYRSGKPYRALDRLARERNWTFDRWLSHPSYDRFWQHMVPFQKQFGKIGIPVLSITGYYADGEPGAYYYFSQHRQYRKDADHTLLIGPWAQDALRDGTAPRLDGYTVDAAALLDLQQLRLQWFDHVFRKAALPPPLQDRVNYEVMGANQWRHAPSLEAMADGTLKYYLAPAESGPRHRLAQAGPPPEGFIGQTLHFTDRRDADWTPPSRLLGRNPEVRNGLSFLSEPLPPATELDGVLSGTLDLRLNRMDLDLRLSLYEQLPNGDCLLLAEPYQFRASYAADRIHRRLLKGGERQQLAFRSDRLISRRLQAGSRVLLVLEVNKRPDQQINYGGGDEVSAESMADAGRKPLRIRWYGGSFVELPVRKQP